MATQRFKEIQPDMIFIFSASRSGSTWLAKAFDSHPDTIYLHEPDIVDRGDDLLPFWFVQEPQGLEEQARQYLLRLSQNRSLRTVGTRPFFRKKYRGELKRKIRTSLIYMGKGLEKAGFNALAEQIAIPDLIRPGFTPRIVIKSVSALGRVEVLVKSADAISPVLLLRNPCAFVHSYMRGNRMGVMRSPPVLGGLLETRAAQRLNASATMCDADDLVERLAWVWLLANCEAYAALSQRGGAVIRYEDLTNSPESELRALFSKLGLDWSENTTEFLRTSSAGDGSYYSIARDPVLAANKWKSEMDKQQVEKVRNIVCLDPIGQQYFR
jgi:Sulfotransferase family